MEEKKNNQVQAMDDDALENIAGGRIVNGGMDYSKQEYVYPWDCRNCGRMGENYRYPPVKCDRCGSSNLYIYKRRIGM